MKPITFTCEETLPLAPEDIARQILDLTKWPDFHGYGPIPGIKVAEFAIPTPGVVGSRTRVTSLDGSSHVEEVVEWQPDHRARLRGRRCPAPARSPRRPAATPLPRRSCCGRSSRVVEGDAELLERLRDPDYPGKVERAILFTVEAWDINCPQHIHKRFSQREVQPVIEQLQRRISGLEAQVAQRQAHDSRPLPA